MSEDVIDDFFLDEIIDTDSEDTADTIDLDDLDDIEDFTEDELQYEEKKKVRKVSEAIPISKISNKQYTYSR